LGFWGAVLGARLGNRRPPYSKHHRHPPYGAKTACTGQHMGGGGGGAPPQWRCSYPGTKKNGPPYPGMKPTSFTKRNIPFRRGNKSFDRIGEI
jgi:hypothetical protein